MQVSCPAVVDDPVRVSIPDLVGLSRPAASIRLGRGRILSRQSGDYQSPFRGRGMEFDESRLYQPGDDIRNIDWRVTARTGKTHTKLFREERERPVFVWLDLRASMHFATRGKYKSVIAAELAAMIAWSALSNGDRVGGVVFSDREHHELKPQRGKSAVLRLINRIVNDMAWSDPAPQGNGEQSLEHAALRLRRVARPGSLIFLISDFRHLDDQAEIQLSRLSRHNEVVILFVYDRLEQALPPPGRYKVSDGRQEFLIDTSDNHLVRRYQLQFKTRQARLVHLSRLNRMILLPCRTDAEPLLILLNGLKSGGRISTKMTMETSR